MRRTRSKSCASVINGGRRSLRGAQEDYFNEMPPKIRGRVPQTESKATGLAKLATTRRSVRLSGASLEMLQLGSRTRKRRLQSLQSPDRKDGIVNGPKSPKVERFQDASNTTALSMENGICSRTRRKFDSVGQKTAKDISNTAVSSVSTSPKSSRSSPTSSPKQGRITQKHSKPSPPSHCTNGSPLKMEPKTLQRSLSNLKQPMLDSDKAAAAGEDANSEDTENSDNCNCSDECGSSTLNVKSLKCELCGRNRRLISRKNGSVMNGSLESIAINPRNLRSSGRPSAISSLTSMDDSGSPIAGEEAGSKEEDKISNAANDSSSLSKDKKEFKRAFEQTDPEKGENDKMNQEESEGQNESPQKITQSPLAVENCNKDISLQRCEPSNADVQNEQSGEGQFDDTENPSEVKPAVNGFGADIIDEFSGVDYDLLGDGEDCLLYNKKKRKMNLRSSGVRCDPDFYTLSLDLMIKRPRLKSNLWKTHPDARLIGAENGGNPIANLDDSVNVDGVKLIEDSTEASYALSSAESDNKQTTAAKDVSVANEVEEISPSSPCTSSTPLRQHCQKIQPRKGRYFKSHNKAKLERSPNIRMVLKDPDEPPPLFTEEPPNGPDVYYFESDHVALKHNRDYHHLLHTVTILESQRHQCLYDLQALEAKKSDAMLDPIAFVGKLQSKECKGFPHQQSVPDLPDIEWAKYSSVYGTFDHVFSSEQMSSPKKPVTRKVKINFETGIPSQTTKNSKDKGKSQGPRSQSFGIPWTVEEQRKLEELLVKYPSEENESSRYRKIAEELGSRTALQVQSRVQKYFIKLAKAGLPVPGTMPKLDKSKGRARTRARPHPHHHLTKLSTFFPTFHCPVKMLDDEPSTPVSNDDEDGFNLDQDQVSDEDDVPEDMRYSDEYLEILRLKRIRRERLRVFDRDGQQALAQHVGYECDMCNSDPIQGVRYHCIDCPSEEGVDLCQSCIRWQGKFETEKHKASHRMEPVYKAENFMDDDYLKFVSRSGEYNYLDPNFLPPKT